MRTLKAKPGNPPSMQFYYDRTCWPSRSLMLTDKGMKHAIGCTGPWPMACRLAWEKSEMLWCRACEWDAR